MPDSEPARRDWPTASSTWRRITGASPASTTYCVGGNVGARRSAKLPHARPPDPQRVETNRPRLDPFDWPQSTVPHQPVVGERNFPGTTCPVRAIRASSSRSDFPCSTLKTCGYTMPRRWSTGRQRIRGGGRHGAGHVRRTFRAHVADVSGQLTGWFLSGTIQLFQYVFVPGKSNEIPWKRDQLYDKPTYPCRITRALLTG